MDKRNELKKQQLGMSHGTAGAILRKALLFDMARRLGEDDCFQCGQKIHSVDDFSIEHKTPYLNSDKPLEVFLDISNIAFSHLSCNIGAARKRQAGHGTRNRYASGCRCQPCKTANTESCAAYKARRKTK